MLVFDFKTPQMGMIWWFKGQHMDIALVKKLGLLCLQKLSHRAPNPNRISAFVERWQLETNSLHLPFDEMIITLDDVFCLT